MPVQETTAVLVLALRPALHHYVDAADVLIHLTEFKTTQLLVPANKVIMF